MIADSISTFDPTQVPVVAVNKLAQAPAASPPADHFFPTEPSSLKQAGLTVSEVEGFCLRYLLNCGTGTGRAIAENLKLPFVLVAEILQQLKDQLLVTFRDTAAMSDYVYELSEQGLTRARRRAEHCTYFGAAPVRLADYIESVKKQGFDRCKPKPQDLRRAFQDLQLSDAIVSQIGQAVTGGRAMFLYGFPGNGKTAIAERVVRSVGEHLWIPRSITVTDEIIRLYDPACHEEIPLEENEQIYSTSRVDRRWVRIKRPTVVMGGELTLEMLECHVNPMTGINEAPVQMKSNGGCACHR